MSNVKGKTGENELRAERGRMFTMSDCSGIAAGEFKEEHYIRQAVPGDNSAHDCWQISLREICIAHHTISLQSSEVFQLSRKADVFLMYFVIRGNLDLRLKKTRKLALSGAGHNMMFYAGGDLDIRIPKGEELEFIEVQLAMPFVDRYISANHILHNRIRNSKQAGLSAEILPLSPHLNRVLYDLSNCEFEGYLKSLYIQGKVIELMSLQLAQFEELGRTEQTNLKTADIYKMNVVRALITSNPEKTYNLAYLARAAGTNEQYLKTNFKQIYGKTVFNYLTSYRMELAKDMLMNGQKKISEIAEEVGYKHSTHFTQAFKKHFGYLPNSMRG